MSQRLSFLNCNKFTNTLAE